MGSTNDSNENPIDLNKLEKRFKYPRLRLKDEGDIIVEMKDKKIGIISKNILNIYETKSYQKIYEIKTDINEMIKNVTELDNYDLVIILSNYVIKIYTLKNEKYELFQIINDANGYKEKMKRRFNLFFKYKKIYYELKNIIKFSNNRFMTMANFGFKIYSKVKDSKYKLSFANENESHDFINNIYVINENELIIIYDTYNYPTSMFGSANYIFEIDKFDIKTKSIIAKIYYKKESSNKVYHFSDFVILKKKYLIIILAEKFYIVNIVENKIKSVTIPSWKYNNNYTYNNKAQIYGFESTNDDIFLLFQDKQFFVVQFNEKLNNLKIIGSFKYVSINKNISELSYDDNKSQFKKINGDFIICENGFINFY